MVFLHYLFWKTSLKEINFIYEFSAGAVERKPSASKKKQKTVLNAMKGRRTSFITCVFLNLFFSLSFIESTAGSNYTNRTIRHEKRIIFSIP